MPMPDSQDQTALSGESLSMAESPKNRKKQWLLLMDPIEGIGVGKKDTTNPFYSKTKHLLKRAERIYKTMCNSAIWRAYSKG